MHICNTHQFFLAFLCITRRVYYFWSFATSHPPTQHIGKKRKEEEKKEKDCFLFIFCGRMSYMRVCSTLCWMNIFLFFSLFTTINASERASARTNKKKCSTLVGRLELRMERNVIWSLSCRLWLIDDRCKRAEDNRERCAETMDTAFTRAKVLIGWFFLVYVYRNNWKRKKNKEQTSMRLNTNRINKKEAIGWNL